MAISCGSCKAYCCRVAGKIMKELDRGDGVCKFLTEDNKCSIYEDRPFICNTDRVYDKYFKDKYTKEEWIKFNIKACKELHEQFREEEDKVQKQQQMEELQKGTEERSED